MNLYTDHYTGILKCIEYRVSWECIFEVIDTVKGVTNQNGELSDLLLNALTGKFHCISDVFKQFYMRDMVFLSSNEFWRVFHNIVGPEIAENTMKYINRHYGTQRTFKKIVERMIYVLQENNKDINDINGLNNAIKKYLNDTIAKGTSAQKLDFIKKLREGDTSNDFNIILNEIEK